MRAWSYLVLLLSGTTFVFARGDTTQHVTSLRVVNGEITNTVRYPWQVAIFSPIGTNKFGTFVCGGTVIGKRTVLTAAHCIEDDGTYWVRVGIDSPGSEVDTNYFRVASSIQHPEYKGTPNPPRNDIAVLSLDMSVGWDIPDFRILALAPRGVQGDTLGGTPLHVSGYGSMQFDGRACSDPPLF